MQEIFSLDSGRLIFVSFFFLLYFLVCIKTKKPFFYTVLFLLAIFPLNITLQQPNFNVYVQGIYSNYLVPTLSIIDVFIFFLLIASFFEKKKWNFSKNTTIFFVTFFLFLTLKAYLDNSLLSTLLLYRIFFYTLGLFLVVQHFNVKKHLKSISWILFFSVLIQFVIGIFQFKEGTSLGLHFLGESTLVKGMFGTSFIDLNGTLFLRAYGTFPHPNILAGFLLTILFFNLAHMKKERVNIVTAILVVILMLFTFSRIIAFLAGLLLLIVFFKKNNLFVFTPIFLTRFTNLFENNDKSFSDRLELLKSSWEIIKRNLSVGVGTGRFVEGVDLSPVYTAGGFLLLQPVHNSFLLLLSEQGLFFGLPMVVLILLVLLKAFSQFGTYVKYGVLCLFVVLMLDHYLVSLPQGNLLLIALLVFLASLTLRDSARLKTRRRV